MLSKSHERVPHIVGGKAASKEAPPGPDVLEKEGLLQVHPKDLGMHLDQTL